MKKYSGNDERVLTNIIQEAGGTDTISRSRARYKVVDIPAQDFDKILTDFGIRTLIDRKNKGKYYVVEEVKTALKKLLLERGIRPKLNPEVLQ